MITKLAKFPEMGETPREITIYFNPRKNTRFSKTLKYALVSYYSSTVICFHCMLWLQFTRPCALEGETLLDAVEVSSVPELQELEFRVKGLGLRVEGLGFSAYRV